MALVTGAAVSSAHAVGRRAPSSDNPLQPLIRAGLSAEEFDASALSAFDEIAGKGGAITAQAVRDRQAMQDAPRRAAAIGAVLRYDLDNDLRVTMNEILTAQAMAAPAAHPARTKKVSAPRAECDRLMQTYDSNRDGVIEMVEISQASLPEDRPHQSDHIVAALLGAASGKDGKLTRKEVKAFAHQTFRTIDIDGDGRLSSDEYEILPPAAS